jgi:hypothetical protein
MKELRKNRAARSPTYLAISRRGTIIDDLVHQHAKTVEEHREDFDGLRACASSS